MVKRRQLIPWRAAGTRAEMRRNADEVVRDTGWVFNNQTGDTLTLDEFVRTGDAEWTFIWIDLVGRLSHRRSQCWKSGRVLAV